MVGGLTEPTFGDIRIDGKPVTGPGRDRGFVFQGYSLFEWLTVEGNIRFALEKRGSERVVHHSEGMKSVDQQRQTVRVGAVSS